MDSDSSFLKKIVFLLFMVEPKFLIPGTAPVLAGTALGFALTGELKLLPALLALIAIMLINAGSNMINDYYDHKSGNDWYNYNPNQFGGGSRYIQEGKIKPKTMKRVGFTALGLGAAAGLIIVWITQSWFILALGIIGVAGGYFWTAPPLRICYRVPGEAHIFIIFGLLPTYGAYYIQTGNLDWCPLIPASIIGILIAMVALINAFPDYRADKNANKKTTVVVFGVKTAADIYRFGILSAFAIAFLSMNFLEFMLYPAILMLPLLPIGLLSVKYATKKNLTIPGFDKPNKLTIILYVLSGIMLSAGFVLYEYLGLKSFY